MPGLILNALRTALATGILLFLAYHVSRADAGGGPQPQFAMFYHPPRDGMSAQTLTAEAGGVIFTYGDEAYLRQMRDHGFTGPALQYLMANETSGPPDAVNSSSPCGLYEFYPNNLSGLAGDFCSALHRTESNFLHNSRGQRLYSTQSWVEASGLHTVYIYLMNPSAPGWQAYVQARLPGLVANSSYTGVFLDNLDLSPARGARLENNSDGSLEEYPSTGTNAAYLGSMLSYLDIYRATLPSGMKLWANMTEGQTTADNWDAFLPYLDGVMDEAFAKGWTGSADETAWLAQLQRMEAVLSQNKCFLAVVQGEQSDAQLQQFGLASFLLAADNNAYFRYANETHYEEAWWYPNYASKLGEPTGARYQNASGVWQRDFAYGSVTVDLASHTSTITSGNR